jgi:hypothetical protein
MLLGMEVHLVLICYSRKANRAFDKLICLTVNKKHETNNVTQQRIILAIEIDMLVFPLTYCS